MRSQYGIVLTLVALVFVACGGSAAGSRDVEASQRNERWEVRLRIPGEVRSGEMVQVDLSLKNISDETLTARIDCVSAFGLTVVDGQGRKVFDWYDYVIQTEYGGGAPQCPLLLRDMPPSETLEQTVSFTVDEGGEYAVQAVAPPENKSDGTRLVVLSLSVKVHAR